MIKRLSGFTLAEVLIVVGIIGVIGAFTIPQLVQNHQKQAYLAQLKKFYSTFQAGIKTYMAKEGCNDLACTDLFDGVTVQSTQYDKLNTILPQIFKIDYYCIHDSAPNNCTKSVKFLDRRTTVSNSFFRYGSSFKTSDGALFEILDDDAGNCTYYSSITANSKIKNCCSQLRVDVNGDKGPDIIGRDIFMYYIALDGTLYPNYGIDYAKAYNNNDNPNSYYWRLDSTSCGNPATTNISGVVYGYGCSARIMEQGWEMNY